MRYHGGKLVHHATSNAHVVGVSRATDPHHLKILGGFDEKLMKRSLSADEEIDRLRNDPASKFQVLDLEQLIGFKITFYNMQGLRSGVRVSQLKGDSNLMQSDILLGCETNLNIDSKEELYSISGYYDKHFNGKLILNIGLGWIRGEILETVMLNCHF